MCAQSSMEVIGGIGRGAGVVVSRVGSGALVAVGTPPHIWRGDGALGSL